jgi:hypothetical protein
MYLNVYLLCYLNNFVSYSIVIRRERLFFMF